VLIINVASQLGKSGLGDCVNLQRHQVHRARSGAAVDVRR
jgi:hypothetical protein